MTYLRNYAVLNVKDRLARIDGVGQVLLFGSGDYSMRVWLDPRKVAERGLSAGDVVRAIREQNVQAAAGVVGASPGLPERRPAALDQRAGAAADRGGIRRHHREDRRRAARSRACATWRAWSSAPPSTRCARSSTTSPRWRCRSSPRPTPTRSRSPTTSARRWPRSRRPCPRAWTTRSSTTRRSSCAPPSRRWCTTLLEAILLVVLVVILFLQTWRASIIPLLAVPVSVIGTFAVLHLFGFSINALSPLRPGARHRHRRGRRDRRGRERRAQHRGGPLAARRDLPRDARGLRARSSPSRWCWSRCSCRIAFISGLSGQFYKQFALTIAISTVISAINSLTLSPALAALLLQGPRRAQGSRSRACMDRAFGWFFRGFNRVFKRGAQAYTRRRRRARIARKGAMLGVYVVLVVATVGPLQGGAAAASCRSRTSST